MASQQMDALGSFAYLIDNIPNWRSKINSLSSHASTKNTEFVAEYTRLVKKVKPRRIRSPSMASIRSEDERSHKSTPPTTADLPSLPGKIDIDPLMAGNKYLYAQAQRKRKPDSSVKSGASGPQKFRSKHQVIIYYDSHIQEELDNMVKALGIARNNLRKGKNALAMSRGFQLPSLSRRHELTTTSTPSTESLQNSTPKGGSVFSNKNARGIRQTLPASENEAAFMKTDKDLETIQSMCETAAHQFLRDGDCRVELESVTKILSNMLLEAESTLESLKKVKEEEDSEEANSQHTLVETESHTSSNTAAPVNVADKLAPTLSQTIDDMKTYQANNQQPPLSEAIDTSPPLSTAMEIEVDDNEDDDDSILLDLDFGKYRLMRTTRIRA